MEISVPKAMPHSRLLKDLWLFGVFFCLGLAGACAFSLINPIMLPNYFKPGVSFFFLITTSGALGGILYSTKDRLIEVPHHENKDLNKISLGYFADILGGIGGAYIIFMVLPYEFHQVLPSDTFKEANKYITEFEQIRSLIQIIAVSMIGGYSGRALIEVVQSNLLKDVKQVAEKQDNLEAELRTASTTRSISYKIIEDPKHPPSESEVKQLKEGLSKAMSSTRSDVFYRALSTREKYAIELISMLDTIKPEGFTRETFFEIINDSANAKKFREVGDTMEATIVIFKSLVETIPAESDSDESSMLHRYHGQLAYAMKDLLYCQAQQFDNPSKWSEIITQLDNAIRLRPAGDHSKDTRDLYSFYELNKAIALIEKEGNYAKQQATSDFDCEKIIELLRKGLGESGRRGVKLRMIFPICAWIETNPSVKSKLEAASG
jgi:hypothetical protein